MSGYSIISFYTTVGFRNFFFAFHPSYKLLFSIWILSPSNLFFLFETYFQHFTCIKTQPFQLFQMSFPICVLQWVQSHSSVLVNLLPYKYWLMEIFLAWLRFMIVSESRLITKPRSQCAEESIKPQLYSLVLLSLPAPIAYHYTWFIQCNMILIESQACFSKNFPFSCLSYLFSSYIFQSSTNGSDAKLAE